ncbi:MAG: alpha/beta hydrolase [Planctomycetota bacterium]
MARKNESRKNESRKNESRKSNNGLKMALVAATAAGFVGSAAGQLPVRKTGTRHEGVRLVESRAHESRVTYHTVEIGGVDVFYRAAGPEDAPAVLLLHGFPTSSHMFRDLIPRLSENYRVVAPDYPGYGNSAMPDRDEFEYTFDNYASIVQELIEIEGLESYSLYLMDYGAPVGYRVFAADPERVDGFIIQNGNAYEEGLRDFWDPIRAYWAEPESSERRDALRPFLELEGTKWQYLSGVRDEANISPDTWDHVQPLLDRPGNKEIQLDLFLDYGTNPPLYPEWQAKFREFQPPALIVWGANDPIFPAEGAHPYKRDLEDVEFHLFDTGHFALEEDGDAIAGLINKFLKKKVGRRRR